jgi:polar amino acid transport system substrate-binding protein
MLQLFVLFFLLPELGIQLPPLAAGIGGLAINYSAYEAEIYRATGGVVEFALASSLLYLAMSLPLSWLSRWSERRLGAELPKGGAPA